MSLDDAQQTVDGWLKSLGSNLGLPLALDDTGVCALEFTEGMLCAIEVPEQSPVIHIYSTLGELPSDTVEAQVLMQSALEMNMLLAETRGAALALSRDTAELMLCFNVQIEWASAELLANVLNNFFETALACKQELWETLGDSDRPSDDSPPMMRI